MNGKTNASDITINQVVNGVLIPLESPTNTQGVPQNEKSLLRWTDPLDKVTNPGDEMVSEWSHTIVVRRTDRYPNSPDDGDVIVNETTRNSYSAVYYNDTNLTNGITYYYAIFAINTIGLVSDAVKFSVIPQTGIVRIGTITDNGSLYIDLVGISYTGNHNRVIITTSSNSIYHTSFLNDKRTISYDGNLVQTDLGMINWSPDSGPQRYVALYSSSSATKSYTFCNVEGNDATIVVYDDDLTESSMSYSTTKLYRDYYTCQDGFNGYAMYSDRNSLFTYDDDGTGTSHYDIFDPIAKKPDGFGYLGPYMVFGPGPHWSSVSSPSDRQERYLDIINIIDSDFTLYEEITPRDYYVISSSTPHVAVTNTPSYVLIAGGVLFDSDNNNRWMESSVVTLDSDLTVSTSAMLDRGYIDLTGESIGNFALFAGGVHSGNMTSSSDYESGDIDSNTVDTVSVFDDYLIRTSADPLSFPRRMMTHASFGKYGIFFLGSYEGTTAADDISNNTVFEVYHNE